MSDVYKKPDGKWAGRYTDEHGRRRQETFGTDKLAAQKAFVELKTKIERIKAGVIQRGDDRRSTPLSEHLEDYLDELKSNGCKPLYISNVKYRLNRMIGKCGFTRMADIGSPPVARFLEEAGIKTVKTRNDYLCDIKTFAKWLRSRGLDGDPLRTLKLRKVHKSEDSRPRRVVTPEEEAALIEATKRSPQKVKGVTGAERVQLYRLALWTGFRASELKAVRVRNVFPKAKRPHVELSGKFTKNGEDAKQFLPPERSGLVSGWLQNRKPEAKLWRYWESGKAAAMLRVDLEAAEIPYVKDGLVLDFHAFRHTYITRLVQQGINAVIVQKLARHEDIRTTMRYYTHIDEDDLFAAMSSVKF